MRCSPKRNPERAVDSVNCCERLGTLALSLGPELFSVAFFFGWHSVSQYQNPMITKSVQYMYKSINMMRFSCFRILEQYCSKLCFSNTCNFTAHMQKPVQFVTSVNGISSDWWFQTWLFFSIMGCHPNPIDETPSWVPRWAQPAPPSRWIPTAKFHTLFDIRN